MRSRLRGAVVVTFVLGLVLSGVGAVVAKSPEERRQIAAADRAAQRFDKAIDRYAGAAAGSLKRRHDADKDGYPALLKAVASELEDAPRLSSDGTTPYGRAHSDDYRKAVDKRSLALQPLASLRTYLEDSAIPCSRFITAGKKLVQLRPGTLLGDDPVYSGQPLRDRVLPPYKKARTLVKDQDPPSGAELLQLDLTTFADDMIAMTKDGAKKIDDQKPFFFELGNRPVELLRRLAELEAVTQGQVAERVDLLAAAAAAAR
jgi:hypothetical protein